MLPWLFQDVIIGVAPVNERSSDSQDLSDDFAMEGGERRGQRGG